MKTVIGLFDTYAHAETAAHDLENAGIQHSDISLVANNTSGQFGQPVFATTTGTTSAVGSETAKGAVAGGVTGLLLGLAGLAIPGLGAIAVAGWLTTTIAGAVVGAGVGLVGALMGAGVPHEEAAYYAEGVRRGGTLLAARVSDEQASRVAQILSDSGAVNINERAEQYRREGFTPDVPIAPVTPAATPTAAGVTGVTPAYATNSAGVNNTLANADTYNQSGTLRRTENESMPGDHVGRTTGYDAYEPDFRNHWRNNYANQGDTYEYYIVAYQYGYDLNSDPRYRGRDWDSIQSNVQRDWEIRKPGTWDRVKNAVRYAWDKTTGAERGGIQTGGQALDGTPDTRGITEKIADTVTGDRIDDKTGKPV